MEVQFVASIAPIVRDLEAARAFYQGALGLSPEGGGGDYKMNRPRLWTSVAVTTAAGPASAGQRAPPKR
jgi:catechol 2,3-dioxygenase-like lactoylglutathione lyase family enzyme